MLHVIFKETLNKLQPWLKNWNFHRIYSFIVLISSIFSRKCASKGMGAYIAFSWRKTFFWINKL